jgi:crotonobetainyl-CoA:carnitine CoA-transferase CaiB-like acyl-CoA transferase
MSNFSNRVLPNLGLTNERLLELNPKLIAVTMPGYGPDGPWEGYVGYAIAFEQLICGSTTGYADGVPSYAGGLCDPLVGLHTVAAIELALRRRDESGRGVEVEVPQCETLDSLYAPEQIAVQLGAPVPARQGNKHDTIAPHDAYRCQGDDQWITIAAASDEQFAALANAIGQPQLATDARFATATARKQNETALDALLAEAFKDRDAIEVERELQAAGVAACHVNRAFELASDPGLAHIGFFAPVTRPVTGTHVFKRWPFRFSSIDAAHKRPPPLLGQHTAEVLRELLNLADDDLAALAAAQVTGTEPTGLKM